MTSTGAYLGMEVDLSLPAERVIRSPDRIIAWRGKKAWTTYHRNHRGGAGLPHAMAMDLQQ